MILTGPELRAVERRHCSPLRHLGHVSVTVEPRGLCVPAGGRLATTVPGVVPGRGDVVNGGVQPQRVQGLLGVGDRL